jgi:hypothetical protein
MLRPVVIAWVILCAPGMTVHAQFKQVGPPPVSAPVARQQIRALLEKVDSTNLRQTVDTISSLNVWYRDLADQELTAAWRGEGRARLPQLLESLADAEVATAIVEFSWRQQRDTAFTPEYAATLGMLMARYPASAKPFRDDLLTSGRAPDLSPTVAETVCRILIDMPEVGTWRKDALQILPHYRAAAENLLNRDLRGSDGEKSTAAGFWLADLKWGSSDAVSAPPVIRRHAVAVSPGSDRLPPSINSPVSSAPDPSESPEAPVRRALPPSPPPVPRAAVPVSPPSRQDSPPPVQAQSGTLQCVGAPIPQNAEYVFRNVPLGKLQLEYDTRVWDVRIVPGEGQMQRLILRNVGPGPQKRCTVHWSVVP